MTNFITHPIGLVHFVAAIMAMLFGGLTYATHKGSAWHKRIGYVYVVSMVVLLITAFMSYQMTGRFGPFHVAAIVSSVSVVGAIVPVMLKDRVENWLHFHYKFINWSVVGLYAAFWAETLTRLVPMRQFWPVVVVASGVTAMVGRYLIDKHEARYLGTPKKQRETPAETASKPLG